MIAIRALGLEQLALELAQELMRLGAVPDYADGATVSPWAAGYVELAQELGLMVGIGNNRFAPVDIITRAHGAVLMLRLMERMHLLGE